MKDLSKVTNRNNTIAEAIRKRQLLKDIKDGRDGILKNKEKNVPKLEKETLNDYEWRLANSTLVNIMGKTIENFASKPFKKSFEILSKKENEDEILFLDKLKENFDGSGVNVNDFLKTSLIEVINFSQVHIFVDFSNEINDENLSNHLVSIIDIENILDFEYKFNNLVYLRFYNIVDERDGFDITKRYYINEYIKDGKKVIWNNYKSKETYSESKIINDIEFEVESLNNNFGLDYIPLFSFYPESGMKKFNPDLAYSDVAHLQLSHFIKTGEKQFLESVVAHPKLIIKGFSDSDFKDDEGNETNINGSGDITTNSKVALALNNEHADAKWLSAPQDTLESLGKSLETIEDQIQLLTNSIISRTGAVTATEIAINENNSNSSLLSIAVSFKKSIADNIIDAILDWNTKRIEYESSINTDFSFDTEPTLGAELLKYAFDSGTISRNVLFDEIKRRGVINDDVLFNDMQDDILKDKELFPIDQFGIM